MWTNVYGKCIRRTKPEVCLLAESRLVLFYICLLLCLELVSDVFSKP